MTTSQVYGPKGVTFGAQSYPYPLRSQESEVRVGGLALRVSQDSRASFKLQQATDNRQQMTEVKCLLLQL
jgi:hypothetical protein